MEGWGIAKKKACGDAGPSGGRDCSYLSLTTIQVVADWPEAAWVAVS